MVPEASPNDNAHVAGSDPSRKQYVEGVRPPNPNLTEAESLNHKPPAGTSSSEKRPGIWRILQEPPRQLRLLRKVWLLLWGILVYLARNFGRLSLRARYTVVALSLIAVIAGLLWAYSTFFRGEIGNTGKLAELAAADWDSGSANNPSPQRAEGFSPPREVVGAGAARATTAETGSPGEWSQMGGPITAPPAGTSALNPPFPPPFSSEGEPSPVARRSPPGQGPMAPAAVTGTVSSPQLTGLTSFSSEPDTFPPLSGQSPEVVNSQVLAPSGGPHPLRADAQKALSPWGIPEGSYSTNLPQGNDSESATSAFAPLDLLARPGTPQSDVREPQVLWPHGSSGQGLESRTKEPAELPPPSANSVPIAEGNRQVKPGGMEPPWRTPGSTWGPPSGDSARASNSFSPPPFTAREVETPGLAGPERNQRWPEDQTFREEAHSNLSTGSIGETAKPLHRGTSTGGPAAHLWTEGASHEIRGSGGAQNAEAATMPAPRSGSGPTLALGEEARNPVGSQPESPFSGAARPWGRELASPGLASLPSVATGQPGDPRLSGPQTPRLKVEKVAPEELIVGKSAVIYIRVSNIGELAAEEVEIRDWLPRGTRLIATRPQATIAADGRLVWPIGTVPPGQEVSVELEVLPLEEGESGSVAEVHFAAPAGARFRVTKPELELRILAPEQVLVGMPAELTLRVSNPGSGPASQVVVEAHLPDGLTHPAGQAIMYEVGPLAPGESRELRLSLQSTQPGKQLCRLVARGEPSLRVVTEVPLEVTAPQLELALVGSRRRYLDRQAPFELTITNKGTAPARQVRLTAMLPQGLEFVSANNNGAFDPVTRRVRWLLEELPVGESGTVRVVVVPRQLGRWDIEALAEEERGSQAQTSLAIDVEGIAALQFHVVDKQDPVALGGECVYEIYLSNAGSKKTTSVRVSATIPPGLRVLSAEGPVRYVVDAGRVAFEPLAELTPRTEVIYRLTVQAVRPGDQRIRVEVTSDDIRTPIVKEENTHVYAEE